MSALKSRAASAGSVQWGWASTQVATLSGLTTVIFLTFFLKIVASSRDVAFQRGKLRNGARAHVTQDDDLFLLERRPLRLDRGIERLEKIGQRPRVATRRSRSGSRSPARMMAAQPQH